MEILTARVDRRSTRVRVEIPVSVISLDRRKPFGGRCTLLVVSATGCGFRCEEPLDLETPLMLSDLPGGGSVTARVATCLPLGNDGQYFLIGAALYAHGNVWGIADPPADWSLAAKDEPKPVPAAESKRSPSAASLPKVHKQAWPYNLFSSGAEAHPGRK